MAPTSKNKVRVICDYCGKEYIIDYGTYNNSLKNISKSACNNCKSLKSSEVKRFKNSHKIFEKLNEICEKHDYTLLTSIEQYTNTHMRIQYICPKHGVQNVILDNLLRGHYCFQCSYEHRTDSWRLTVEHVKQIIESKNNNKWLNSEEYKDSNTRNLRIKCGQCGEEFITSYRNYTAVNVDMCPSCSQRESKSERKIRKILVKNSIKFEQEK